MSIRLHTPGPWTVDYTDDNLRIYSGDLLIGEVNGSTEHIETMEANAWLIAAAPDPLAALERILARVGTLNLFTEREEEAKVLEARGDRLGEGPMRCVSSGTPETTGPRSALGPPRDNLEWRLAFCDRVGVGGRVSDVIGHTARILTVQNSAEPSISGRAANCQNEP